MAAPSSTTVSGPAEVLDRILDKGPVLDAWVRVSMLALDVLTVEARDVLVGVETHLRCAEAIGAAARAT